MNFIVTGLCKYTASVLVKFNIYILNYNKNFYGYKYQNFILKYFINKCAKYVSLSFPILIIFEIVYLNITAILCAVFVLCNIFLYL